MTTRTLFHRLSLLCIGSTVGISMTGCFDPLVIAVNDAGVSAGTGGSGAVLPALLIDDFEDGNRVPSDLQFGPWRCYTFSDPNTPAPQCGTSTMGYLSQHGYYVDFKLVDTKNGRLDYPGVSLASQTVSNFDASQYGELVFSVTIVPHDQVLPTPVIVLVNLLCSGVSDQPEPNPGVFAVSLGAEVTEPSDGWYTFSLELTRFAQLAWAKQQFVIDKSLCIQRIDGLQFIYQLEDAIGDASVDGQSVAATMTIDKVYFQ